MVTIAPAAVTLTPHVSQVTQRPAVNDQQEPAPPPNDLTLDSKYRGFIPIPNTPVLIKFNAKPRVDITDDPRNTGNEDRFVTATIPVDGDPFKGGGNQFNINAKGSQLSIDVRAPTIDGNPRVYFQNDFFGGSGGEHRASAYHMTHYGSLNLVWQMRKRLSPGLEGLYGRKEKQGGAKGDAFRLQLGLVYSLFD